MNEEIVFNEEMNKWTYDFMNQGFATAIVMYGSQQMEIDSIHLTQKDAETALKKIAEPQDSYIKYSNSHYELPDVDTHLMVISFDFRMLHLIPDDYQ